MSPDWALAVQRQGRRVYGESFRFIAFDLAAFHRSDRAARRRLEDGNIRFCAPVLLGDQFILFSGSIAPSLVDYRIDPNRIENPVVSPFDSYRFSHPQTLWFNLAWMGGSAQYFPGNSPQILDFYAQKISQNIRQGKRTLLISKKNFVARCATELRRGCRLWMFPRRS